MVSSAVTPYNAGITLNMALLPLSSEKLKALPSHWSPKIQELASVCEIEGTALTLRTVLFALRDMPYERPRGGLITAKECITQWRGTCSAKHLAVYELLDSLKLSPKLWLASYPMDFTKPYYSHQLREQANGLMVYDVHNYVTCDLNGRLVTIDITFPAVLGVYGLPVTKSWSGNHDFVLCCVPEVIQEVRSLDEADSIKRQWLRDLNASDAASVRENAIVELMQVALATRPLT